MKRNYKALFFALFILILLVGGMGCGGFKGKYKISGKVTTADKSQGIKEVRLFFSGASSGYTNTKWFDTAVNGSGQPIRGG